MSENIEIRIRKSQILISIIICFFLLINSAYADDKINISMSGNIETHLIPIETKYPVPVFIKTDFIPTDFFSDDYGKRMDIKVKNYNFPFKAIDLDKNGMPEYIFFMTNFDNDSLEKGLSEEFKSQLEYQNSPPNIKYENQTLIYKWEICWQKDNGMTCGWQVKQNDFFHNSTFHLTEMRNRFDLYTIADFNTSPAVKNYCPLALDLGTWPQEMIFFIANRTDNGIDGFHILSRNITNYEIYNGTIYQKENEQLIEKVRNVYDSSSLILIGTNRSVIITKPSLGRFNPSSDYFFKTEILANGNIRGLVCTTKHNDILIPPKGPNAYFIFGEPPNDKKLFEMSMLLTNLKEPVVYPTEFVQVKYFKGAVWPLGSVTAPEIVPKIKFNTEGNFFDVLTFTWINQEGQVSETIQIKDGTFTFEQPILLNSSNWMYPFDTYEAIVYVKPPVILKKNSSLSFDLGEPYEGMANFESDKVLFSIVRNNNSKIFYFIYLVFSIVIFTYSYLKIRNLNKQDNQPKKQLEKLGLIAPLLGYFYDGISEDHIFTIGTIPYVIMVCVLIYLFYSKNKS